MKPLECYSDIKKKDMMNNKMNNDKGTKENNSQEKLVMSNYDMNANSKKEDITTKDKKDNAKESALIKANSGSDLLKYKIVNDKNRNKKKNDINKDSKKEDDKKSNKKNLGWFDLLFMVGVVFAYLIYGRSYVNKNFAKSATLINQLFIYVVPFLYALIRRTSIKELYSIKCPHILDVLSGISIVFGAICLDTCLSYFISKYLKISDTTSLVSQSMGFGMAVLSLAVFPAVCEELFYRGYVCGILNNKANKFFAVVLSAAVFGAFHMNLVQGISAFMMGIFLAFVVCSTKSILVVILMHFLNNFSYLCMVYFPKEFSYVPFISKKVEKITDVGYLMFFALVFIIPGIILGNVRRKQLLDS